MRGVNSVIGFAFFGLIALGFIWYLSPFNGFCGDKSLPCRRAVSADPGAVAGPIVLGIVGLITIMLIANGLFMLFRARRREG